MRHSSWLFALSASASVACGSLTDSGQPLHEITSVRGRISAPVTAPTGPVSMAIIWATPAAFAPPSFDAEWSGGPLTVPADCNTTEIHQHVQRVAGRFVSQSVTYAPEFPLSFEIPIDAVPPAEALVDLAPYGGSGSASVGFVIAYLDGDGDSALTLPTALASPDTMLATMNTTGLITDTDPVLLFLDGTLPATSDGQAGPLLDALAGAVVPQGFTVAIKVFADAAAPVSINATPTSSAMLVLQALPADMTLMEMNYLCSTVDFELVQNGTPFSTLDLDPVCTADGTAYRLWFDERRLGPCSYEDGRSVQCTGQAAPDGAPECSEWLPQ